ncbi:O-antigen translocase [Ferrimonas sp. SCSIO 43195]|uniref:O-antigen translocase n=1 Tax=Ferrimonas sp. SCSIO 43195 TaxID=2822844 RepID=UPI00207590D2|nr:O-antigen translocase [Ferrimonas sp. SCSIO 43195]
MKIVAVVGGPSGVAAFANIQNYLTIAQTTSGNALQTGITKYTSSIDSLDKEQRVSYFSAAIRISVILWIITSLLFYFFFYSGIESFLESISFNSYPFILILSIPFCIVNTLYMAYLNGLRKIREYIYLNIGQSISTLILVSLMGYVMGIYGVIMAILTFNILIFFVMLLVSHQFRWCLTQSFLRFHVETGKYNELLRFSLITVTTILVTNLSLVTVRGIVSDEFSSNVAGIWQGVWSLSQVALSFLTLSLSTYLLPALSAAKNRKQVSTELKKAIWIVLPIAILSSLVLYVLKDYVILILYTPEFLPIGEMLPWQLAGNTIKSVSWLFGYILVAKAMVKLVIFTELIMAVSLIGFTYCFSVLGNENSAVISYFITSVIHLGMMLYIFLKRLNIEK